ncbi:hypothetical protein NMG60_11003944 [Bertholletia excelsa]
MEGGGEVIAVAKTPDKTKRDEWSEGGVVSLLDVYEAKWTLRNRAKLKGSDWEEIARQVSARGGGKKSGKTPNQCKNKIEAMKKRYRIESAGNNHAGSGQSWQFYTRMDRLVKGTHCSLPKVGDVNPSEAEGGGTGSLQPVPHIPGDLEDDTKKVNNNCPTYDQAVENAQNLNPMDVDEQGCRVQDSNQDDGSNSNTVPNNGEFTSPQNKAAHMGERLLNINSPKRRKSLISSDIAESIRMLSHSMMKIEQARMEMYRELERLRTEAEIKRAEMDLKKTEIIAKTQLQIAKLFCKRFCTNNNISEGSLAAEHEVGINAEERNG